MISRLSRIAVPCIALLCIACGGAPFSVQPSDDDASPGIVDPAVEASVPDDDASRTGIARDLEQRDAQATESSTDPDSSDPPPDSQTATGPDAKTVLPEASVDSAPEARPISTCETICLGCCDESDNCQEGTNSSACGVSGASCVACSAGESCQKGTCSTAPPEACAPVVHSDGFGQSFTDCAAPGDYSQTLAVEACQAYASMGVLPSTAIVCAVTTCEGIPVIEFNNEACILWSWSGNTAGHAIEGDVGGPCVCPTSTSAPWS
jgi:hypothetical protein